MNKEEHELLLKEKNKFKQFYFKTPVIKEAPIDLFKTNVINNENIKEQVKDEIELKSVEFDELENKGVKLTVTEKITSNIN
jgi:hypothetical protein